MRTPISTTGVACETIDALEDARAYLNERGLSVTIKINSESDVTRDVYNSIKTRVQTDLILKAFPVDYHPSQYTVRRAGIKEGIDLMITLATQDFTDNSISYEDIDQTRWEIEVEGHLYTIKDKNQINHFGSSYLNIVIGLDRK